MGREKIVYLAKRSIVGLVVVTALLVALSLGNGVAAQEESETRNFELTPSRDSGVSGTASLKDVEGGVEVTVNVAGLEGGEEYTYHIHEDASCEEDKVGEGGPVEFPLNEVVANYDGTATSTWVVRDITVDELFGGSKDRYINFHPAPPQEGQPVPPGITCATLDLTDDLPESGGPALLLPAAGVLLLTGGLIGVRLVRRS